MKRKIGCGAPTVPLLPRSARRTSSVVGAIDWLAHTHLDSLNLHTSTTNDHLVLHTSRDQHPHRYLKTPEAHPRAVRENEGSPSFRLQHHTPKTAALAHWNTNTSTTLQPSHPQHHRSAAGGAGVSCSPALPTKISSCGQNALVAPPVEYTPRN